MADTSEPVVANIPHESRYRFECGDDTRDLYEQMSRTNGRRSQGSLSDC